MDKKFLYRLCVPAVALVCWSPVVVANIDGDVLSHFVLAMVVLSPFLGYPALTRGMKEWDVLLLASLPMFAVLIFWEIVYFFTWNLTDFVLFSVLMFFHWVYLFVILVLSKLRKRAYAKRREELRVE